MSVRRTAVLAFASLTAVVSSLALSSAAQAQPVESGSFTMTGDPGDYISLGQDWSYDTSAGDTLTVTGAEDDSLVNVNIRGANGDWWYADFEAPQGETLQAGTYTGATRYPFNGDEPGLSIDGDGRGCNTLTGSFTITEVSFGPNGWVEDFDATFEQHCEGSEPAARGRVQVHNPQAPEPLALSVTSAPTGTFDRLNGQATVHGTVACSAGATVYVNGNLTQVKQKTIIRGSFDTSVKCEQDTDTPWSATITPGGTTPYQLGRGELTVNASATDPAYGKQVTDSSVSTVLLVRG